MRSLVERGAERRLSFSQRPPPAEEKSDPLEPRGPASYDLIHEIDPGTGQRDPA